MAKRTACRSRPWQRWLAAILNETKLRRVLAKMLDENEFLSPYGVRALSRYHTEQFLELGKIVGITEVEPVRRGRSGAAAPSRKR